MTYELPASYDPDDNRSVDIPRALIPIIAGRLSGLEDASVWIEADQVTGPQAAILVQERLVMDANIDPGIFTASAQLVTWTCTSSPCPWGNSLTGHALVWPASMEPLTARLGYTTSHGIYLPHDRTAGLSIECISGDASLYFGDIDAASHTLLETLYPGESRSFTGLSAGEVLSVQSDSSFSVRVTR